MLRLLLPDLPGELARLLQHHPAIFRVGVIAEIRAFIDEALARGIHQHGERIGILLELVAHGDTAEFGRVQLPLHRMAARPIAVGARADGQCHAQSLTGIEARAAHLGQVPARSQIARAPLRVRLEAAAGKHHRAGFYLALLVAVPDAHARNALAIENERRRARPIAGLDVVLLARGFQHGDEALATAHRLDRQAAPELEPALDLERLPAVDRHEADALLA